MHTMKILRSELCRGSGVSARAYTYTPAHTHMYIYVCVYTRSIFMYNRHLRFEALHDVGGQRARRERCKVQIRRSQHRTCFIQPDSAASARFRISTSKQTLGRHMRALGGVYRKTHCCDCPQCVGNILRIERIAFDARTHRQRCHERCRSAF